MISIVIPVCDEDQAIPELYGQLHEVVTQHRLEHEIIFVDDGSTDGSWSRIDLLSREDARVKGVKLRRNFGKAAALQAGIHLARGDVIVTLDGDLQDDPTELPALLAELDGGLDLVVGWKARRSDPWHKRWPSRIFNRMVSRLTGVKLHDHNSGFKCGRAEAFREIALYGELHRFVAVLAHARGFRVGERPVHHRPRPFGRSKYGSGRLWRGFLDMWTVVFLTGYRGRPLHFFGTLGVGTFLLGLLGLGYLAVIWVLRLSDPAAYEPLHRRPLLVYSATALVLGALVTSMGFLAELITARSHRASDLYSIAATRNTEGAPGPGPTPRA